MNTQIVEAMVIRPLLAFSGYIAIRFFVMKIRYQSRTTAMTRLELLIVVVVVAGFLAIMLFSAKSGHDNAKLQKETQRKAQLASLGISATNEPTPVKFESHLGGDWVIANGDGVSKDRWMTVIYYPSTLEFMGGIHIIPVELGQSNSPEALFYYEVTVRSKGVVDGATEAFSLGPLRGRNPLFVPRLPEWIQLAKWNAENTRAKK